MPAAADLAQITSPTGRAMRNMNVSRSPLWVRPGRPGPAMLAIQPDANLICDCRTRCVPPVFSGFLSPGGSRQMSNACRRLAVGVGAPCVRGLAHLLAVEAPAHGAPSPLAGGLVCDDAVSYTHLTLPRIERCRSR